MGVFREKSLAKLLIQASEHAGGLKRTLTAKSLIALGIGAIIGAGLFVRMAAASAQAAGPPVTVAILLGFPSVILMMLLGQSRVLKFCCYTSRVTRGPAC